MRKSVWVLILSLALGAGGTALLLAQEGDDTGKPQFTTYPIFETFRATTLVNGRVVYVPPVARHAINNSGDAAPGGQPGPPGGGGGGGGGGTDFGQNGAVSVVPSCFPNSANNFDATCAADSYQGEPMLAADSTGNLVGAENDIYPGNCSASATEGGFGDCGLSATVSTNGNTWDRFKLSRTWGGHSFLIGFDPSVAVDSLGRYFVAYGVADSGVSSANGVVVVSSADSGATWKKTNPVVLNLSGGKFEDKYWIVADNRSGGSLKDRLYVAWTRNQGNNQILMTSFSSNQGQSWSAPKKINDGTSKFERVLFAFPAVAPDGTVYVLWQDYARNQIFVDRSTDGGASWGADRVIANLAIDFPDLGCNGGRTMSPAPQMAVDSTGAVYAVWADDSIPGAGLDLDVYISKSTNGGVTWSARQRVSSTSAGHQYLPAISIGSDDSINVSYLDRRDDTGNCRTHTYLSRSADGGTTFSNSKVTDEDSHFDGNPNGPGDYQGIACRGTVAHPYFSDHRGSNVPLQTGTAGAFEIYTASKP